MVDSRIYLQSLKRAGTMKVAICVVTLVGLTAIGIVVSEMRPDSSKLPMNKVDAIVFLDENHGFVQQQSRPHPEAFETLDGGKTWRRTNTGVQGFRRGRSFATNTKGWSIDEDLWNHGVIFATDDGGNKFFPW